MKKHKRLVAGLVMALAMAVPVTAYADELDGASGWKVTFTEDSKMSSNFRSAEMDEAVAGMQPGDAITFHVRVQNDNKSSTEWYMSNETLYSLEDRSRNNQTAGGAYEYELVYVDRNGDRNVLFSSDTVGGEKISAAGEGLHEATSALEDYFYIDDLAKGQYGDVYLRVELDGETQGNDYQDTLADLQLNFAVTAAPETPVTPDRPSRTPRPGNPEVPDDEDIPDNPVPRDDWVVRTGDDFEFGPRLAAMGLSGLALLLVAAWGIHDRRKEARHED